MVRARQVAVPTLLVLQLSVVLLGAAPLDPTLLVVQLSAVLLVAIPLLKSEPRCRSG